MPLAPTWWRRHSKRLIVAGLLLVGALVGLGWYSYHSSGVLCVDSWLPALEVHLKVLNQDGLPVKGASFTMRRRGKWKGTVVEEQERLPLYSDSKGQVLLHTRELGYGGTVRRLFWLIDISDLSIPEFECRVSCAGYQPASFDYMDIPDKWMDQASYPAGRLGPAAFEQKVYTHVVILTR
jgi:hypothetical protein